MKNMFIGKSGIYDHNPKAENQTARIYDCYVEHIPDKKTSYNSDYYRLVAKAYIPKCERNNDLIFSIDSGITKEVSVGCCVERSFCSICGNDNFKTCNHKLGKKYGDSICHRILDSVKDAYEWSFVAVPAQRQAGVIKSYIKYKGEIDRMDNIFETIQKGNSFTLTGDDCKKIDSKIKELEILAYDGKIYKEELQKSLIRLYALNEPDVPSNVINSVVDKMNVGELKAFKKAYENKSKNNSHIFCNINNKDSSSANTNINSNFNI